MKCPKCQTEMIKSKVGWLCPNCGYVDVSGASEAAPVNQLPATTTVAARSDPKTAPSEAAPKTLTPKLLIVQSHQPADPSPPSQPKPNPVSDASPLPTSTEPVSRPHHNPLAAKTPALKPKPKNWPRRALIVTGVALVMIILAGVGYVLAARQPYQDFQRRLSSSKTLAFNGQLKFSADGFLSSFGSDMNFDGHYDASGSSPKGDISFKGSWSSQQYDGQAILSDGSLFFKLTGPVLPVIRYNQSSFLYPITPDWYKTKIDNSLYGNYCETRPDTKYPQSIELYRLLRNIKTTNSPLVNLFARLNGQSAAHYHGTVPSNQIPNLISQLNSQLPETCGIQYQPPSDTQKLAVSYDLWAAHSADRVRLTFEDKSVGAKLSLTTDLSAYNQPVNLTPPTTAIDLNVVRQSQLDLLDRDHTRRNDIDKIKAALTSYAAANKQLYPTNLSLLSPKYLSPVPTDPKTKQPYAYNLAPNRKSFTLSANLEEPNAGTYATSGP